MGISFVCRFWWGNLPLGFGNLFSGNHSADLTNCHKARTQKSAILVSIHQKLRKHYCDSFRCRFCESQNLMKKMQILRQILRIKHKSQNPPPRRHCEAHEAKRVQRSNLITSKKQWIATILLRRISQ
ncbi:hypothetical protein ACWIUD_06825 [Helicobacter sp. 23-1044]